MLYDVQHVRGLRRLVAPRDREVFAAEHASQLLTDHFNDALEIERTRNALLDAIDQRQLGGMLVGLPAQIRHGPQLAKRLGGPIREPGQSSQVACVKAAKSALLVDIQQAVYRAVGLQRDDHATTLVRRRGIRRTVAQTGAPRAPRLL
ncbi:MAG: hypothetical protein ACHP83_04380 [Burkholderiales bacterium]